MVVRCKVRAARSGVLSGVRRCGRRGGIHIGQQAQPRDESAPPEVPGRPMLELPQKDTEDAHRRRAGH